MNNLSPFLVRGLTEADKPKVFNDWLKTYRLSPFGKTVATSVYFKEHHALIERLLSRCQTTVLVDRERPDDIWAWGCGEHVGSLPVVHFVWVDRAVQKQGLGSVVLAELTGRPACTQKVEWVYTHSTPDSDRHWPKRGGMYYPYMIMRG